MKNFGNLFWKALHTRMTILLEYEPGDAAQTGYFAYLDDVRRELSKEREQPARRGYAVKERVAGYGNA